MPSSRGSLNIQHSTFNIQHSLSPSLIPLSSSLSAAQRTLTKEAQQIPIVRNRGGNEKPVDAGRSEAAVDLLPARGGAALHVSAAEIDKARGVGLGVGDVRERAAREALFARIRERDGHDVVPAIEPLQRALEAQVEKIGEHDDDGALGVDALEKTAGG